MQGTAVQARAWTLARRSRDATKALELGKVSDWKTVELFEREARVLANLDHPRIPDYVEFIPLAVDRDIKPGNVLLDDAGRCYLVDFGSVSDAVTAESGGSTVAGTFGYMAPEQLHGEAGPSADLYGLGMTLVHLATGREPSELPRSRLTIDVSSSRAARRAWLLCSSMNGCADLANHARDPRRGRPARADPR